MEIRFDRGPAGPAQKFQNPKETICAQTAAEVAPALARLNTALQQGHWLAGYISYEAGYALEPRLHDLMPEARTMPLLQVGVYDAPDMADSLPPAGGQIKNLTPLWRACDYEQAFQHVHDWIGGGDIYQANLTFPMTADLHGDPAAIYAQLVEKQPVGLGALVTLPDGTSILSRSPELFFRTDAQGQIETRPMKGTMPRGKTPAQDAANKAFLENDPKNRAENLMIVDLLRNDISRICEVGSVNVPELFHVESYTTVHQMVSHVRGQLKPDTQFADIIQALFPCGSITGAPKIRSMEIIRALEPAPRDVYCGSIGWMAPDGASEFNVAIRTLTCKAGKASLNVGGGVVWDSQAGPEYEEALWKARYADMSPQEPS